MNAVLYFQSPLKTSATNKLAGISEIAKKANWHLQKIEHAPDPDYLQELVDFWHPIGAIIECAAWDSKRRKGLPGNLPTVFLDGNPSRLPKGSSIVMHDSFQTGEEAARQLLLTQRSSFAYVAYHVNLNWSEQRGKGFLHALKLNGLIGKVFNQTSADLDDLNYRRDLQDFLDNLEKPCAIFAANDRMAEATLAAANALKLNIPDDIAILGVDNHEDICLHTQPTLSSIEPDFRTGGRLAALALLSLMQSPHRNRSTRIQKFGPLRTILRESTRFVFGATDRDVAKALQLISQQACTGLSSETVLQVFSCSRARAISRFKQQTGRTILQEIHRHQLERAKTLLANRHQSITSISDFCGFTHPNSLKKLFRRELGISMREWRKQNATSRS